MDARSHAAVAPLSEQSALDVEAASWAEQWAVQEVCHELFFPEHMLSAPQPITLWALDQAIASFPVRAGLGAHRLATRAIQRLPIAARMLLIHILLAAEWLGGWTAACNLVLIVLLPKLYGAGCDPSASSPLFRARMRTRASAAPAWEAARALPSAFGSAGRGAQRAAWAAAFAAEASATSAHQHVASLLDLVGVLEPVPRRLVAAAAARLCFDLIALRPSLAAYRLARAIGRDLFFATLELQMLLHESVLIASRRWHSLRLYLCVDDLTIVASDFSEEALVAVARGTSFFVGMFGRCLKLAVSASKSFAVASRPSLAASLSRMFQRRLLVPKCSVKMLGTAYAGGRARAVGVFKARLKQFKIRIPRVHALRRHRVDTARVVKAIGGPCMLRGMDIIGASSTHQHSVRVAALCAALPPGTSRNVDVAFAVLDAGGAALDPAYAARATPLRHWGVAHWQEWAPAPEPDHAFDESGTRQEKVEVTGRSP
ncbi:unnamed protein product [Prorocentrum cordatum]|uniref:Reverse transcriptase domain-containing protein n=1 Tax=Prorocentrum cordatum TaxID=2364126 RepID=A0ABN9TMU7_9DINO|nr:unnamed protein product [Polarella glacialis]